MSLKFSSLVLHTTIATYHKIVIYKCSLKNNTHLSSSFICKLNTQKLREQTRDDVEKDLKFAGFVIISCPLKSDSKSVIRELQNASHCAAMITGDNPLTASHLAKELKITTKTTLNLTETDGEWSWESIDQNENLPLEYDYKTLIKKYDLCITGDALTYLRQNFTTFLNLILPHIKVFARFAPKQKEFVVVQLKSLGYTALMCGDGTNDVGALKHADVGVAILANAPEKSSDIKEFKERMEKEKEKKLKEMQMVKNKTNHVKAADQREKLQASLNKMMKELEETQVVKLGDASIASPFTSKLSSIMCSKFVGLVVTGRKWCFLVCHIIKQGRCTLVTTLQMFKILALNALILAYTQSVLYLDGIKLRDMQATLQGLLLAACFLFISRSKVRKKKTMIY